MVRPIEVTALAGYKINVLYEDNTEGIIELGTFIEDGILTILKDKAAFEKVYVTKFSMA